MRANAWSGKRILVAGGAGFIGSHLIDRLVREGADVTCLDNFQSGSPENLQHWENAQRIEVIRRDVVTPIPRSLRPDVVFNLACVASPPLYQVDPVHTMLTNVLGTHNLLEACAEAGSRFILASTSEVYGDPASHPQTEIYWGNVNPNGPRACYDEGKRAAEALAFDYLRHFGLDVRVARIFNTYGPRMRPDDGRVVSNIVTQALAGADITLYGDGTQTRSFCFVDDMVDGLLRLAQRKQTPHSPVNLGNPAELSVLDLATRILSMCQSHSRVVFKPLPVDDPKRRRPDISLAMKLLRWRPLISLDDGLKATIAWFRDNPARCTVACSAQPTLKHSRIRRRENANATT